MMGGFRFLHSHEYGQTSGRAGRRGKDDKGVIIHLNNLYDINDNNPDAPTYRKILCGAPNTLSLVSIVTSNSFAILASGNSTSKSLLIKVCCIMKSMVKSENYWISKKIDVN